MPRVKTLVKTVPTTIPRPLSMYDSTNAKKGPVIEVLVRGVGKRLFPLGCQWRWKHISGKLALEVFEGEQVQLQVWAEDVVLVGGPQWIFRDAEWR